MVSASPASSPAATSRISSITSGGAAADTRASSTLCSVKQAWKNLDFGAKNMKGRRQREPSPAPNVRKSRKPLVNTSLFWRGLSEGVAEARRKAGGPQRCDSGTAVRKVTRWHCARASARHATARLSLLPRALLVPVGFEPLAALVLVHLETSLLLEISHGMWTRLLFGGRTTCGPLPTLSSGNFTCRYPRRRRTRRQGFPVQNRHSTPPCTDSGSAG